MSESPHDEETAIITRPVATEHVVTDWQVTVAYAVFGMLVAYGAHLVCSFFSSREIISECLAAGRVLETGWDVVRCLSR